MSKIKIYLAGGMGNLPFEESERWRKKITGMFAEYTSKIQCINPNNYFNFLIKTHESEREVREFDLHKVRNSDLVIVNFNDEKSIGTAQELAVAYEYRIPVIGLNEDSKDLHPWLTECCNRVFHNYDELTSYIMDHYID